MEELKNFKPQIIALEFKDEVSSEEEEEIIDVVEPQRKKVSKVKKSL